jgi:hypothetical protein
VKRKQTGIDKEIDRRFEGGYLRKKDQQENKKQSRKVEGKVVDRR